MARRQRLENFRHGVDVVSADAKELGKLHAVVVDPRSNEVTHVVVNAGPHFPEPGFGDPALIEVPVEEVADAGERRLTLRASERQFQQMPVYAERRFFPATPAAEAPAGNVLWNTAVAIGASLAGLLSGIAVPGETFRRAQFERHILNDAPVWRLEPHQQIGEVERVLADDETEEIEALVIRRGWLFGHEVVLPMRYVTEILDGVVHVSISDRDLEALAEFRE